MGKEIELNNSGVIMDMDESEVYIEDISGDQMTLDSETAIEMAEAILKYYQT